MNSVTVAAPTKPLQGQVRWDPTLNKKLFTTYICWQREKNQFSSMEHPWVYQPCPGVAGQHNMNSMFLLLIFLFFMDFLFHFGIFFVVLDFYFLICLMFWFLLCFEREKKNLELVG